VPPEKLDKLFVVVTTDREGNEGIVYLHTDDRVQPLIASDEALMNKMYPLAVARALETGDPVKILLFEKVGETDVNTDAIVEPLQDPTE
jgi:hypothetical protein